MRHTSVAVAMAVMVWACGSTVPAIVDSPSSGAGATSSSTGAQVRLDRELVVREDIVEASVADVWRVLPRAWEDANVPLGSIDNARHTLQSGAFRAPRSIVGKSLSEFFDCGYTMAGPRVTLWQVSVEVAGAVLPDPAGAKVATRVDATAQPRDGTSTNSVTCTSRGELERIIAGNVRVRLGK
jgi:hypothetical protein